MTNRRKFLQAGFVFLAASGLKSSYAQIGSGLFKANDRTAAADINWTLGQYQPLAPSAITPEDLDWYTGAFQNFFATERNFDAALKNAAGKNDPASLRFQNFEKAMCIIRGEIDDKPTQIQALKLYVKEAVKYTKRPEPKKGDSVALHKWVLPLDVSVGSGEGECAEQTTAIAKGAQMIFGAPEAYLFIVTVHRGLFKRAHAVAGISLGKDMLMVDPEEDSITPAITYFSKGSENWDSIDPKIVLTLGGKVLWAFDQKSKNIPADRTRLDIKISSHDKFAIQKIEALVKSLSKLPRGHYAGLDIAEIPRPALEVKSVLGF